MIDRDEEKIGRAVRRLLNRQRRERFGCPDEENLASYLSGLLPEDAKKDVEAHLVECSYCLDDLVAVHKVSQDYGAEAVPQRLIERAMGLVRPTQGDQGVFDLVVRLVKDAVELVSTSGRWAGPLAAQAVGVRGRPAQAATSILQVEKEMGRYKVAVEVELVETGLCQVAVRVTGEDGKPAEGIRLSLVSRGREQASYLTRQGEAMFDRIPLGEYNLAVSDSGTPVGTIRLRLTQ